MTAPHVATVNGIRIAYRLAGATSAPTVVLHHPLATNMSSWDEATEALLARGYRVLRLDARGHGASDAPAGPYAFETLAADVVALMDHVGIEKARFVGLSMGGMVGQYLGLIAPHRFSCLSLVSTTSAVPQAAKPMWDEGIATVRAGGMGAAVDGALARWVSDEARSSRPDLVARLARMIETTPLEGYIGWCSAISALDVTERLSTIDLPVQVVVGALDPATPPAAAEVIHRRIRGSEYAELARLSHMLQLEDPAAFHAVLVPFLDAHGPAAG